MGQTKQNQWGTLIKMEHIVGKTRRWLMFQYADMAFKRRERYLFQSWRICKRRQHIEAYRVLTFLFEVEKNINRNVRYKKIIHIKYLCIRDQMLHITCLNTFPHFSVLLEAIVISHFNFTSLFFCMQNSFNPIKCLAEIYKQWYKLSADNWIPTFKHKY